VAAHVADTVRAGAGLCDEAAVRSILSDGAAAVAALQARGAAFDLGPDGRPARTREGGHSALRVIHAGGDATGAEVQRTLLTASRQDRLPLLTRHTALDVLRDAAGTPAGLAVLDEHGRRGVITAPAVLLASGGYGRLFAATTNPATATGDGLALALRAGAAVADLEFVQFHPTALHTGRPGRSTGASPLVTEALRGEGAVLLDGHGRRIMDGVHPLADLAPRDVVAAAITRRMAETGSDHVLLDATAIPGFADRFPTVHASCARVGIDPTRRPIPVSPAAHYACGGVITDLAGRSTLPGLYAAGEVARTGLHGANRLASNSLLEGLVMGARAARAVVEDAGRPRRLAQVDPGGVADRLPMADRATLRRAMSACAGIGRDGAGLAAASDAIEARTSVRTVRGRRDVEDAALTLLAGAVLAGAGTRTESRGCHIRTDFPRTDDRHQRCSLVVRLTERGLRLDPADDVLGGAA
jgi:L-aspartate oxidase